MGSYHYSLKLKRFIDVIPHLLDERFGIIQNVWEQARHPNMPDFHLFMAITGNTNAFLKRGLGMQAVGAGVSTHRDLALIKALGEGIERYCGSMPDYEEMVFSSYSDLKEEAVFPGEFALFSHSQYSSPGFPCSVFDEHTKVYWCRGKEALTNREVWVPAQFVYVPYQPDEEAGEVSVWKPISTGLACHCSWEEAALNGLLEVVERDSFTITWQARMARPQIELSSLLPEHLALIQRFSAIGYSMRFVDATNETGIPTVIAYMTGLRAKKDTVPFVVASATHLSIQKAITKSIEELALMERYTRRALSSPWEKMIDDGFTNINGFIDHIRLWNSPGFRSNADFLLASNARLQMSEIGDLLAGDPILDYQNTVARIYDSGYRVINVDLTTPVLRDLGLAVIRTLIPGYHPLVQGHKFRSLGGKRLWEIPQKLGYKGIANEKEENIFPHPFA